MRAPQTTKERFVSIESHEVYLTHNIVVYLNILFFVFFFCVFSFHFFVRFCCVFCARIVCCSLRTFVRWFACASANTMAGSSLNISFLFSLCTMSCWCAVCVVLLYGYECSATFTLCGCGDCVYTTSDHSNEIIRKKIRRRTHSYTHIQPRLLCRITNTCMVDRFTCEWEKAEKYNNNVVYLLWKSPQRTHSHAHVLSCCLPAPYELTGMRSRTRLYVWASMRTLFMRKRDE